MKPNTTHIQDHSPLLLRDSVIRRIDTRILDIPTVRRHKLSNTVVTHQNYVHVDVLLENGARGIGEASTLGGPRWSEESVEAIKANIDRYLAPALIGKPACQPDVINQTMNGAAKRNFAAKSAINSAVMDALGRTTGQSVAEMLGGAVRDRFSVIWALASGDPEQELEEAKAQIAARRFNRFKIKLGFADIKSDLKRLEMLRMNLPADTQIIADINQGWSEDDCRAWFPALAALNLSLIEQPVDAGNIEAMARLAATTDLPLMLDESVFTPYEAARGVALSAGSVLSLKLCKHGSMQMLQQIASIATDGGLELYGGCLLESSIGAAAHLAVFSTLPELPWGCEHFGPLILSEDTAQQGLIYEDYHVLLPKGPGLGVALNDDVARRFARKE